MRTFRAVYYFMKPYRKRIAFALLGTTVFTVLGLMPPMIKRYLLDHVVKPRAWERLVFVAIAIGGVPVLAHVVRYVNIRSIMLAGRRLISDVRLTMYRKILELGMRYHSENPAGALTSRLMADVNALQRLLTGETVSMVVDVVVVLVSFSLLLSISPKLAGIAYLLLVLYVVVYVFFSRKIRKATRSYRAIVDRIAGRLQETVTGVRQVRIYNREEWESNLFLEKTAESLDRALAGSMGAVNLGTACMAISGFGSTVIIALGARMVLFKELSFGDIIAFDSYLWMLINPVVRLTTMAGQITETGVSLGRIMEVLDSEPEIRSKPGAPAIRRGAGRIEFRNISFSYEPDKPLFEDLSFTVEPRQTIALVGPTGCGKTTLTSLMMRYYDVTAGAVLVDGVDIRDVRLESLRSLFGVVLQDPVLFDGTIAENIAYGDPRADRKRIVEAARVSEVEEFAGRFRDGLDTEVGTSGVGLSVGEKQRISLARALLKDPLILILDEATSSLDSHSEAMIQKALEQVLARRTSFVVAHRLSTITSADTILVMDQGRIVQRGSHDELMKDESGMYSRLYSQLAGSARDERKKL